jgi:hypothetical protein
LRCVAGFDKTSKRGEGFVVRSHSDGTAVAQRFPYCGFVAHRASISALQALPCVPLMGRSYGDLAIEVGEVFA